MRSQQSTTPKGAIALCFNQFGKLLNNLAVLRWQSSSSDYTATQQVVASEWSDGELIRYAMDAIDNIWKHWNRLGFLASTRREEV